MIMCGRRDSCYRGVPSEAVEGARRAGVVLEAVLHGNHLASACVLGHL